MDISNINVPPHPPFTPLQQQVMFWIECFEDARSQLQAKGNAEQKNVIGAFDVAAELVNGLSLKKRKAITRHDIKRMISNRTSNNELIQEASLPDAYDRQIFRDYESKFGSIHSIDPDMAKLATVAILFETTGLVLMNDDVLGEIQLENVEGISSLYASLSMQNAIFQDAITNKNIDQLNEIKSTASNKINDIIEKKMEYTDNLLHTKFEDIKNDFKDAISERKSEELKQISTERSVILKRFENEAETRLNSKLEALTSNLILAEAIMMWTTKSRRHTDAYWLAAFTFGAMIIGPLAYGLTHLDQLISNIQIFLPVSENIPFGRLVIITAPLLGYAWMLRLVSRYLNQNLNLAHDADQRRVMARTFVQLVSEGAAKDDQDRATILTALFRPMPGTNTDDDQPPNVIGMIKKEIMPERNS